MKIYQRIAVLVEVANGAISKDHKTSAIDKLEEIIKEKFPHGSGFDEGVTVDLSNSTGKKIVFKTKFHHLGESGCYEAWTSHAVTIRPSFVEEIDIEISGRNYKDIKDFIHEAFYDILLSDFI